MNCSSARVNPFRTGSISRQGRGGYVEFDNGRDKDDTGPSVGKDPGVRPWTQYVDLALSALAKDPRYGVAVILSAESITDKTIRVDLLGELVHQAGVRQRIALVLDADRRV